MALSAHSSRGGTGSNGPGISALDVAKEQIAYLKLWLGMMVVTDISLFGWLVSSPGTDSVGLVAAGFLGVVTITIAIALLHRQIDRKIAGLREL